MDKDSFGAALAEHRKKQGMTQRQLAEKLHLTDKAVSKWERGLSYPDVTLLKPLADALSVSVETLLRCEGPVPIGKDEAMQEEKTTQQEPIQNLVELSSENLRRERRRSKKWIAAVAAILVVLTIAGNLYYRAEQKHRHTVENMGTVMLEEKDKTGTYLYVESLDHEHMLRLKGAEGFDRSAREHVHGLRPEDDFFLSTRDPNLIPYYRMVYEWDDRTYEGTIFECTDVYYYAWEDLYGADCKIDKQHADGVKLDAPLWNYDETYCLTSENTIRFYTYFQDLDQYYLNDLNVGRPWCVASLRRDEVIDWQGIDCDRDGELELIVHTRWPETPYALYDTPMLGNVTKFFLSEAEYQQLTSQ